MRYEKCGRTKHICKHEALLQTGLNGLYGGGVSAHRRRNDRRQKKHSAPFKQASARVPISSTTTERPVKRSITMLSGRVIL